MTNISQHSVVYPLTQYLGNKTTVNITGNVIAASSEVHTAGKADVSLYGLNSLFVYKNGDYGVNCRVFANDSSSSQENGYQNVNVDGIRLYVQNMNYVAFMTGQTNFNVIAVMWNQMPGRLAKLGFGDTLSPDVMDDEEEMI